MKNLAILVLFALLSINSYGMVVYSNAFDTVNSLNGLIVNPGDGGEVTIESGQLKLVGAVFTYKGAYVSIHSSLFASPYTGILSDISGKVMWSFNLSNMDDPSGGKNNSFEVSFVNSLSNPYDSHQYSYEIDGGGFVRDRMVLYRASHTWSPYGNDSKILIDVPSDQGLAPLPMKGSFRIECTPSTGLWEFYAEYGGSYVDPRGVNTLIGYAYDNKYANDQMPYLTLFGGNSGAVYIDNLTVEIVESTSPPVADADGPYTIFVGDGLTLDASGSTDADGDIVSYMWDLDDDGIFETDAGAQGVVTLEYSYLESIGLGAGNTYNISVLVTDSEGQSETAGSALTILPPVVIEVGVDIKPGSCPNPLNVKSKGVLPVAILGGDGFDVRAIDVASVRLVGVAPLRSSYEDVGGAIDLSECECGEAGADGIEDLTLKFDTQKIVEALGEVSNNELFTLLLEGVTSDEVAIEGGDCVVIKGNHKPINEADLNRDEIVDIADFAAFADNWLESSGVK